MNKHALAHAIKAEAQRLGFPRVGITSPAPPPHLDTYLRWIEAGRHGEMAYLATDRARQRRADPQQILPGCQSILILAAPYNPQHTAPPPAEPGPHGRVAAYAWGQDYHDVFPERMRALVTFIEAQTGSPVPNRWYTDTGPILERDLAQRAGLGWIGKNTCLISPKLGSYFFLAEILLGIELAFDPPFTTDHCGSCTRCLDACPTGCIRPDRTLDARRCISYLTIENKGPIPPELRPHIGDWVFGCDICQEVCPWNQRFAPTAGDPVFAPRAGVPRPSLRDELCLTPQQFNSKFKTGKRAYNPVKRAKRRGYLRNVAVALGNAADPTTMPELTRALHEDIEPLVRGHAAWALGQIGGNTARAALARARQTETDPTVRTEIERSEASCM